MKLLDWLWSLLPDRCEVPGCSRQGIRGNENWITGLGLTCDYCCSRLSDHRCIHRLIGVPPKGNCPICKPNTNPKLTRAVRIAARYQK